MRACRREEVQSRLKHPASGKNPSEWTVLGTPVPRVEIPAMTTGEFEFVHKRARAGMLHGQVVRPPAYGATLAGVDENSV
jgi:hypothetical protein